MINQETYFAFPEWAGAHNSDWLYDDKMWGKLIDLVDIKFHYEAKKTTTELFLSWSDNIKEIKNY